MSLLRRWRRCKPELKQQRQVKQSVSVLDSEQAEMVVVHPTRAWAAQPGGRSDRLSGRSDRFADAIKMTLMTPEFHPLRTNAHFDSLLRC